MFTDQSCYILLKARQHRNLNYAEKENLPLCPKCADDVHKALGTLNTKIKKREDKFMHKSKRAYF